VYNKKWKNRRKKVKRGGVNESGGECGGKIQGELEDNL
jgi:hypothetical protein